MTSIIFSKQSKKYILNLSKSNRYKSHNCLNFYLIKNIVQSIVKIFIIIRDDF